jgi:aprataxin
VITHNPTSVSIRDGYPKSSVHVLLLPRDLSRTHQHPFTAFDCSSSSSTAFLASVRADAARLKSLVVAELRRKHGDQRGRDWAREVMVGVHSVPSMANLHVHVLSRDFFSDRLRQRKHYNSFNTAFFVPLEDFPLSGEEQKKRRGGRSAELLGAGMRCWRCGKGFGAQFKRLKEHLGEEFEEWRKESGGGGREEEGKGKEREEVVKERAEEVEKKVTVEDDGDETE